jgi:hypothetical protein
MVSQQQPSEDIFNQIEKAIEQAPTMEVET